MSTFYIASLVHTSQHHEHITFWARFSKGYTPVIGMYAGLYCFGEAVDLNDGLDCLAVPAHVVMGVASPEPFYAPGKRFYDQRGPAVVNNRSNWLQLIAGSLKDGRQANKIKPEFFRGKRRSFDGTEAKR